MENPTCSLLEWLNASLLDDEKSQFSFKNGIFYLDADLIREKMDIMENHFGAVIQQTSLKVDAIATYNKDTCFWAVVSFDITHELLPGGKVTLWGTASFLMGQYNDTWSYAQIAETLASAKAFSKKWRQFGKDLNKENVLEDMKSPNGQSSSKKLEGSKSLLK